MQVCQKFFLHTLFISHQTVQTTLGKVTTNDHLVRKQRKPPAFCRLPEQVRKMSEVIEINFLQYLFTTAGIRQQGNIYRKI